MHNGSEHLYQRARRPERYYCNICQQMINEAERSVHDIACNQIQIADTTRTMSCKSCGRIITTSGSNNICESCRAPKFGFHLTHYTNQKRNRI